MEKFFETASFHIVKPCNMSCKFCYATFDDQKVLKQIPVVEVFIILRKLKDAGLEKITFAGGEPLLYKDLHDVIMYAKSIGLITSIITNGSLLTHDWLKSMRNSLDWVGLSVDSLNLETNKKIGRSSSSKNEIGDYYDLVDVINYLGMKVKINTVVNIHNQHEILTPFIEYSQTTRWKIFDTLRVEGQNDKQFEEIKSTDFDKFIKRNQHPTMVVETNELMTGSYLLIDPQGRLFENSKGKHTYSEPLQNNDINKCLGQISLNRKTFVERGGIYNW